MKPKKMLITMIASYLCFLLLSFLLTMLLVPHVLQHYLHGISSDPTWQDALHGASVAIQNTQVSGPVIDLSVGTVYQNQCRFFRVVQITFHYLPAGYPKFSRLSLR